MVKSVWILGILAAFATAQTPQRTITPGAASTGQSTASPAPLSEPQPSPDALAEAYRKQLQRMSEAEKKNLRSLESGGSPQGSSSFVQSPGVGRPVETIAPRQPQSPAAAPNGDSSVPVPNLDRSLADLDAIRDKYIDQAGKGGCPPAILMRMADLKWRLGQKGIAVVSPRRSSAGGDYIAIVQDWFKPAEASALPELPESTLEDILPETMVRSRRSGGSDADEDPEKMRRDYEALSQACANAWK